MLADSSIWNADLGFGERFSKCNIRLSAVGPRRLFSATNCAPTLLDWSTDPRPTPYHVLTPLAAARRNAVPHTCLQTNRRHIEYPPTSVPQVALVSWRSPTPLVPSTPGIPRQVSPVIPFNTISGPTPKGRHTRRVCTSRLQGPQCMGVPPDSRTAHPLFVCRLIGPSVSSPDLCRGTPNTKPGAASLGALQWVT